MCIPVLHIVLATSFLNHAWNAALTAVNGLLVSLAASFAMLKWLELNALIVVNWDNVYTFVKKQGAILDQNLGGTGTFDARDAMAIKSRFEGFMAQTAPSAGGFAAGFAAGLRF